jgi:hypothetical protein
MIVVVLSLHLQPKKGYDILKLAFVQNTAAHGRLSLCNFPQLFPFVSK